VAVTDHLLRDLAPIPTRAWKVIDDEARERLTPLLAARRLAEWVGGGGWARDATSLGRTTELTDLPPGVTADEVRARRRQVLPLAEFRVPFTVLRSEIDDIQRGARDPELDDLARAARLAAEFENRVVFHGWPAADIVGIAAACPYPTIALGLDCAQYPGIVARAVDTLRRNGIEGPYALAIGPAGYTRIVETTEHGGYLLIDHLTRVLGGRLLWAPGVDGAVVVSERGGDFLLDVGQDLAVGYLTHDIEQVDLYLEESLTFRVVSPEAAVAIDVALSSV
jgi:uncharacterized linocin/CFP29 family protein